MNILLIGHGSIGARHGDWLKRLGCRVTAVSGGLACPHERFPDIKSALAARKYDGAVVATPTARHLAVLAVLAEAGFDGRILVEKPLFDQPVEVSLGLEDRIHTAYNLRCHPLLRRIRELLGGRTLYSFSAYVGQYLPQWRPGRDYRRTYSAVRAEGGGALRDLSHELDYLQWLAGPWRAVAALGGRVGPLEIDSDDLFALLIETSRCPVVQAQMNYLDLTPGGRREVIINADGLSLRADLNAGLLSLNGREPEVIKPDRDHSYLEQLRAWLWGPADQLCTYDQGLETVRLAAASEKAAAGRCWVER